MTDEPIQVYRTVYNKFDHVGGVQPDVTETDLVDLLRDGNTALGGDDGHFFDGIDGYFVLAVMKKKGHPDKSGLRDEEFFDLFLFDPRGAAQLDLRDLVAWARHTGIAPEEYPSVVHGDDDHIEWQPTIVPSEVEGMRSVGSRRETGTERDRGSAPGPEDHVDSGQSETETETQAGTGDEEVEEDDFDFDFEEDETDSGSGEPGPDQGSADSASADDGPSGGRRETQEPTDGRTDSDGTGSAERPGDDRTTHGDSKPSGGRDEPDGARTDGPDRRTDRADRTPDGDHGDRTPDGYRDDRTPEGHHDGSGRGPTADPQPDRTDDAEILGDDESGGTAGTDQTDDEGDGLSNDDGGTDWDTAGMSDFDDAEILDEDDEDDDPRADGGVPEDLELVADLYDRYRREDTGESGAIPATLAELTTFARTVDGSLAEISYVSDPRSNASAFDFADGERDSSEAYEGLTQYLYSLEKKGRLRWQSLPSYEDEVKHATDRRKKELSPDPSYEQVFSDAEARMNQLLEQEIRDARQYLEKAVVDDLSAPDDGSGLRGSMSGLNPLGGSDHPSESERNVNTVYSRLEDHDVALADEQVKALTEHIAGKAAEEMAEKISEEICSQLETRLREATNDELVRIAFKSVAKSDKVVRTESYRRYRDNRDS
jgi:hypothetical protein